jgi:hypothetical protein
MARTTRRPSLTNARFWKLCNAELTYIRKDAADAAIAMRGVSEVAEAKYLEQMADAETVLASRRGGR